MNAESVRELIRRQPFEPFDVLMTNIAGTRLLIHFPDTDRLVWYSLLHVANIIIPATAA